MKSIAWPALMLLSTFGCVRNDYELVLTPQKDAIQRSLIVRRISSEGEDAPADVARLAKEYGVEPPPENSQQTFQGTFRARMPNDVGGHGTFTHWDSPLGSVTVYVERFRGNEDTVDLLERRQAAANQLVDLTIGWLKCEMEGHPRWPRLQKFLGETFRRDVINISLRMWMLQLAGKEEDPFAAGVSLLQYLVEHDYLAPQEIPAIRRAFDDADRGNFQPMLAWLERLIWARMGDDAPPPGFEFLKSEEKLQASLSLYLETTAEYEQLLAEWEKERLESDSTVDPPEPMQVLESVAMAAAAGAFPGGDQLAVTLKTGRPAFQTNGEWSNESQDIRWPKRKLPTDTMHPLVVYAAWNEPNLEFQAQHFGGAVIVGEPLLNYCVWYQGLSEGERQEWDAFLNSLTPGPELKSQLRNFRFRHEGADLDPERRLSCPAVDLLLSAINP